MKHLLAMMSCLLLFSACSNDGRKVKKFLSRINAREINAASMYIYPGDHPKLSIYADVLEKNPNLFLKLHSKHNIIIDGKKGVAVELECVNSTPYYRNYMEKLGLLQSSGMIVDTLFIRETTDGEKLTFNWAPIEGENLKLATIRDSTVRVMNIRAGKSSNAPIIGKLENKDKIIINDYPATADWVRCFTIDENCNVVRGYVYRKSLGANESEFFNIGIFDSIGLLIAIALLAIVGAFFYLLRSVVEIFSQSPAGWIFAIILLLLLLYTAYQLLEKILFELFIINLPY
jgi:lipoprotein